MYIALETFGDFDVKYTKAFFEVPDGTNTKDLLQAFSEEAGLKPQNNDPAKRVLEINKSGITGLNESDLYAATELLEEWMRKRYKKIKVKSICLSD